MGKTFKKSVFVEFYGPAIGLDLNFTDAETMYMATSKIGLRDWRQMLGRHSLSLSADVNVIEFEAGLSTGVEFGPDLISATRGLSVGRAKGIGATLSLQVMNVYESEAAYNKALARRAAKIKAERQAREDRGGGH